MLINSHSSVGNLFISVALNIQKLVHNRLIQRQREEREERQALLNERSIEQELIIEDDLDSSYYMEPLWWFGFLLITIGEIGNFVAYGFASAVLVAPLGTVALVRISRLPVLTPVDLECGHCTDILE